MVNPGRYHAKGSIMKARVLGGCAIVGFGCQSSGGPPSSSSSAPPSSPSAETAESAPAPAPGADAKVLGFDKDKVDAPPAGFVFGRTGSGAAGKWVAHADASAPSAPNVLAQLDADNTDYRFPVAVLSEPRLKEVRVSVRCKLISGKVDQACGLLARYQDENNYYITRANGLESNIRVYFVKDGKRQQLASWNGPVTAGAWHDYRFEVRGDHLQAYWDGKRVLDHHDATFADAGLVGLWTKADSVTYFDDLTVEELK
jgi:3-keto-disaccharide hydrolase